METARRLAGLIENSVPFDYSDKLGYLTACPSNLGTGLRASVMLHLPVLTESGALERMINWAARQGFTVRGAYGEGSRAAGGFYQMNPEVGEALVRAVVEEVKKSSEGERRNIVDLYCGVGVFGLCAVSDLSGSCPASRLPDISLIGIESGRQAIEFAKRNAANLKAQNAKFFAEEVGRNRKRIPLDEHTTVIVDPPRDGLEPGVAEWLAASKAPRIIYVSCDPATLMRDLRVITRSYDVANVRWFNMFPRTARFETMVVLDKKA